MSAILELPSTEINLCAEYGYSTRDFGKMIQVPVCSDYKSSLMLMHYQSRPLPNRITPYRNHFTLFRSQTEVLVVKAETNLVYNDNDAVLTYDLIGVSDNVEDNMRASRNEWDVSFNRNIRYSNARPENFSEFELLGSGEWWYFDRGVILNGVTRYVPDVECLYLFGYYELHPKFMLRRVKRQAPTIPITTPPTTTAQPYQFLHSSAEGVNGDAGGDVGVEQVPIPSLNPREMLSMLNVASRPVVRSNEQVIAPEVQYRSVVPSLFWLKSRNVELRQSNIRYFIPKNYKCAYGPSFTAIAY